jgi:hypothetical protein
MAEILSGKEVWKNGGGECRMQQVSIRNIQKSESIRRKYEQPQIKDKRLRKP